MSNSKPLYGVNRYSLKFRSRLNTLQPTVGLGEELVFETRQPRTEVKFITSSGVVA